MLKLNRKELLWFSIRMVAIALAYLLFAPPIHHFIAFLILDVASVFTIQFLSRGGAFKRELWFREPNPIMMLLLIPGFLYILAFWPFPVFTHKLLKILPLYLILFVLMQFLFFSKSKLFDFRYGKKIGYIQALVIGATLLFCMLCFFSSSSPYGLGVEIATFAIFNGMIFLILLQYIQTQSSTEFDEIVRTIQLYPQTAIGDVMSESKQALHHELTTLHLRLTARAKEVSEDLMLEIDHARYNALTEIVSIVAHDLAGIIHVLQFCSDELAPEVTDKGKPFYDRITISVSRALEFLDKLRAFDKKEIIQANFAQVGEVYGQVSFLLQTHFKKQFKQVQAELPPSFLDVWPSVSKIDLIHILYNLYVHFYEVLLDQNSHPKQIVPKVSFEDANYVLISFELPKSSILPADLELDITPISSVATIKRYFSIKMARRGAIRNQGVVEILKNSDMIDVYILKLRIKGVEL